MAVPAVPIAIALGTLLYEALNQYGKAGERKTARAQIASQERIAKSQGEISKRMVEESKAAEKKYMEQLVKEKSKERIAAKEEALMQSFISSQDRQMALIMQAIQNAGQSPSATVNPSAGFVNLMRSNL